ncbi:ATP-binding cassette domain-containing protein [Micromonospora avicenniae]|uniref:Putative spermidine/putrescine transport system ATP-binding protein n=1 Tax=Micromonospora avicenniae TaxID=1198245 RepID=A0A1N7BSH0_9ACTN|nr:ATP-binding cassette domain-containing protein [Micromonospora avicenniae]SIR54268.1 putative spermidine/putrescine transport system ATP-binding protein [Micromonospora avicenniae]
MRVTLRLRALTPVPGTGPVSLDVPAGRTVALVAPSRVGTAVARVLVGLAPPVDGRILVGERDVTDLPPPRRQIGYVPAGGALLPQLTVRRNIEYGQRKRERVREMAEDWTATVVERLELAPTLALLPHVLTDAQRFRVALARAAACLPEVLVVDLPGGMADGGRLDDLTPRLSPADAPGVAVLVCTADPATLAQIPARVELSIEAVRR